MLLIADRGNAINAGGYKNFSGKPEHISVAEKAFGGPLPNGSVVHHVDENKLNNKNSNLVVCKIGYHKLIHQRTDAFNASGNADWRRCNICKKYDDPKNLYVRGTSAVHNRCRNIKHQAKRGDSFDSGWQITANGKTMSLHEWAAKSGINRVTISTRIKELGWSADAAVSVPARKSKQAIKDGFEVPGAHLSRGTSLRIK